MRKLWNLGRSAVVLGTICGLGALVAGAQPVRADVGVDPAIKGYEKVSAVDGNLNSIGSDTLNNVMTSGPRPSASSIRTSRSRWKARARPRPRPP